MRTLFLTAVGTAFMSTVAPAAVTFDNLTGASTAGATFIGGPSALIFPNESIAVEITTDAQIWTLDSVDINFDAALGFGSSDLEVELYTVGNPFTAGPTVKQALIGEVVPSSAVENYTPSFTLTLTPNTTFWLHIHVPTGDGDYVVNTEPSTAGSGPWTISDTRIRVAGNWSGTGSAPEIRFNGTAIPEPSSMLLGSLGILGLMLRRQR